MIRPVRFRTMATALALGVMPLAALAPATSALAQAEASNDAAYEELCAAMEAAIDQKLVLDASLAALAREFAGTAEFSQAEAASPGLIAEVVGDFRPIIEGQSARVSKLYRPTTLALFARQFTPEATLSGIETAAPVTREQVQADLGKAASATVSAMSQEDLMELGRQAQANPALLKLSLIGPGCRKSGCRWKTNRSPPRKTRRLSRWSRTYSDGASRRSSASACHLRWRSQRTAKTRTYTPHPDR